MTQYARFLYFWNLTLKFVLYIIITFILSMRHMLVKIHMLVKCTPVTNKEIKVWVVYFSNS